MKKFEDLISIPVSKEEKKEGILEKFEEDRGADWFITYFVYADKCVAREFMDDNPNHCEETKDTIEECLIITDNWR